MRFRLLFNQHILLALICVFISACSNEQSLSPELVTSTALTIGEVRFKDKNVLIIRNDYGGVTVHGNSLLIETIPWQLDKSVEAESYKSAIDNLPQITLQQRTQRDTVFVIVTAPAATATLKYASDVVLQIPAQMECIVEQASSLIKTTGLTAPLTIQESFFDISVENHTGELFINATTSEIHSQVSLPDSGICRIKTGQGNILLEIPATTSALVDLKTADGNISHTDLALTVQQQQPGILAGLLGAGRGQITLESGKGDIVLKSLN